VELFKQRRLQQVHKPWASSWEELWVQQQLHNGGLRLADVVLHIKWQLQNDSSSSNGSSSSTVGMLFLRCWPTATSYLFHRMQL
jgi:hypothetical protein